MKQPSQNLEHVGIQPGVHVADLGAGSGFYTIAVAKMAGPEGKVFAIDVRKDMLDKIQTAAQENSLGNVVAAWGNLEVEGGSRLRDESVDVALVTNTLFQIEDKAGLAKEVVRILKPKGSLVVIDWKESFGGMGPSPDSVVSSEEAVDLFTLAGLTKDSDIDAGEYQYGFVMTK